MKRLVLYLRGLWRCVRALSIFEALRLAGSPRLAIKLAYPIAGGAPTLAELREAVRTAAQRMQEAHEAIEEADDDADLDELERTFTETETAHRGAVERLERAEAVDEARRNAPVDPVPDDLAADDPPSNPRVTDEPLTYARTRAEAEVSRRSIFADMRAAKQGHREAQERLQSHQAEMVAENRAISSADGSGGEFVPPLWMQEEWVRLARAGRAVADSLGPRPLPPGTDTINLPTVSGGTSTAVQTDGGAVSSTDVTTTSVTGAVQTVAGQQDASQQLVDLSVPGIEVVIFDDLVRSYAATLDTKVINGTVTNAKGLNQLASTNGVTYTDASPTAGELYPLLGGGVSQIAGGRFLPPSVIAMHPRRWYWLASSVDSQGRPLVVPAGAPGFNAMALQDRVAAEAVVGNLLGLPVVIDANIPTTAGGGTEDRVLVYRAEDIYLWESEPKLRVFEEVLSNTLQVRFQLYGYYCIIAGRYPKAISVVSGTGLAAPSGY